MTSRTSKRYQVFISSTFQDLREEREEVIKALLELDCIPAGMELFPASDEEQLTLIKQVIDDCDYYVIIVGGRYGSVDAEGISYTEREYDYAISKGIPVLAFVNSNPDAIPAGKTELEPAAREKLNAFRDKVESNRMVKKYASSPELGGFVSRSLVQEIKNNPRTGWVRADAAVPPETLAELNDLRRQLTETEDQVKAQSLTPPPGTEDLKQGADTVELTWHGRATKPSTGGMDDFFTSYEEVDGKWSPSWDTLFKTLGPLLLNESSENILQRNLNDFAFREIKARDQTSNLSSSSFAIENDDFQAVKMQLFALGVIKKSDKKRTASDKASYWALTTYGERRLVALRAMVREK